MKRKEHLKRLFVGIPLSPEISISLRQILQELAERDAHLKLVKEENLHLTVAFLGDVAEQQISSIGQILQKFVSGKRAFFISLEHLQAIPSLQKMRVIWIDAVGEEIQTLIREMNSLLAAVRSEGREEKPHVTLARVISEKNKEFLQQIVQKYQETGFGGMCVEKVVLYSSELTPSGPIYTVIQEFSFC